MILGDNFFYGQSLSKMLHECVKIKNGAKVVLHRVSNPEKFGIATVKNGITGLYIKFKRKTKKKLNLI